MSRQCLRTTTPCSAATAGVGHYRQQQHQVCCRGSNRNSSTSKHIAKASAISATKKDGVSIAMRHSTSSCGLERRSRQMSVQVQAVDGVSDMSLDDNDDSNLSPKERLQKTFNTSLDDSLYLALGKATCFAMGGNGKLVEKCIIEPVGAAGLEAMTKGMATSYTHVFGGTIGLARALQSANSVEDLLPEEFHGAQLAENFEARCQAATRTWDRPYPRESLMNIVPVGSTRGDFNFTTEGDNKRVLNLKYEVNDSDNIKQDMSIDVYGRGSEDDAKDDSQIADLYNV